MPELLRMPEVAAGATSAVLSTWPLAPGDSFTAGNVLAVIETDKAVVDVEAEADGSIAHLLVAEGTEVAIGAPIALIAGPQETIDDVDGALAALGISDAPAPESAPDAGPVQGQQSAADPPPAQVEATSPAKNSTAQESPSAGRIFASPLARRMATDLGIDLATVTGTGPNGRIRRKDIESATTSGAAHGPSGASAPTRFTGGAAGASDTSFTDTPHSRIRQVIATRLVQSTTEAPHFYLRGSACVDRLLQLRSEINEDEDTRVSVNDLVVKAVACAHQQVPEMNVIWMPEVMRQFHGVDIAIAIATDTGLLTPVIRSVDTLTVRQIATTTRDFAERARSGSLKLHELEGGSTSVTNLGMYGTEDFDAIINPPHSSILAVGAARSQPIVRDKQITVGTVMKVSLSVDHRPIDGATAAQWMRAFLHLLEHPGKILA